MLFFSMIFISVVCSLGFLAVIHAALHRASLSATGLPPHALCSFARPSLCGQPGQLCRPFLPTTLHASFHRTSELLRPISPASTSSTSPISPTTASPVWRRFHCHYSPTAQPERRTSISNNTHRLLYSDSH